MVSDVSAASLAAMYQDRLLAHHRAPQNRRDIEGATHAAARSNPLCGDALRVTVCIDANVVVDAAFTGRGCSIAVASASMMTEVLPGRSCEEALALIDDVDAMLRSLQTSPTSRPDLPAALEALRGVAPFPGRHGCASMPWLALRDALSRDALTPDALSRDALSRDAMTDPRP